MEQTDGQFVSEKGVYRKHSFSQICISPLLSSERDTVPCYKEMTSCRQHWPRAEIGRTSHFHHLVIVATVCFRCSLEVLFLTGKGQVDAIRRSLGDTGTRRVDKEGRLDKLILKSMQYWDSLGKRMTQGRVLLRAGLPPCFVFHSRLHKKTPIKCGSPTFSLQPKWHIFQTHENREHLVPWVHRLGSTYKDHVDLSKPNAISAFALIVLLSAKHSASQTAP